MQSSSQRESAPSQRSSAPPLPRRPHHLQGGVRRRNDSDYSSLGASCWEKFLETLVIIWETMKWVGIKIGEGFITCWYPIKESATNCYNSCCDKRQNNRHQDPSYSTFDNVDDL